MLKEMSRSLEIAHRVGSELAEDCGHTKYFNRALSTLDRNSRMSLTISYKTLPVCVFLGRILEGRKKKLPVSVFFQVEG